MAARFIELGTAKAIRRWRIAPLFAAGMAPWNRIHNANVNNRSVYAREVLIPLLMVLAGVLDGCGAGPIEPQSRASPTSAQNRVGFEDPAAGRLVEVFRADAERLPSGLLKITVTLRNKTGSALWADIRTSFLDANGKALEQTNWTPTRLGARALAEYTCTSTSGQAADYEVIIRKPAKSLGAP